MKTKKYGYSTLKESIEIKYAIMVPLFDKQEDGTFKTRWAFVTSIEYFPHKYWKAENKKEAYYFKDRRSAQDFCTSLAWSFTAGYVMEVVEGMTPENDW